MFEGLDREVESQRRRQTAAVQRVDDARVVVRVDHGRGVAVVFGGGAQQRRAADVDVLNRLLQPAFRLGHGFLERIQVDRDQVDARDVVRLQRRVVDAAPRQQAGVNFRVQGFDPAVQQFREAGVVGHFHDRDAALAQLPGGAAGGEDFHAEARQRAAEFHHAALVGDADQGAGDGCGFSHVRGGIWRG